MSKKKKKKSYEGITIRELYEWAVKNGIENSFIDIEYECNDCWYDYCEYVKSSNISIDENKIIIKIVNS